MSRRGNHRRAAELLGALLADKGVKKELREHRVLAHWPAIVGDRVASRSTPDGLSRGVLWVRVANSAWLHELSFLRDDIISRANELCGNPPLVSDVKFHLGPRRRPDADDALAPTVRIRRRRQRQRPLPPPATGERLDEIRREASGVDDDELRDIIVEARRKLNL